MPEGAVLLEAAQAEYGSCLGLLGTTIQVGAEYRGEWEATRRTCWAAFHLHCRSWLIWATPRKGCGCCTDVSLPLDIGVEEAGSALD